MFSLKTLTEFEIDTLLLPARFWLRNLPTREAHRIVKEISKTFAAFKDSVADDDGRVPKTKRTNLLSGRIEPETTWVDPSTVESYECAGPDVANGIDLVFKLWLDEFPPFRSLISKYGSLKILALTGIIFRNEVSFESLIRLNNLLSQMLSETAGDLMVTVKRKDEEEGRRAQRDKQHQTRMRGISAEKRRERTITVKAKIQQAAFAYWKTRPSASVDEVKLYLSRFAYEKKKYAPSYIETQIKGVKSQALEALSRERPA